MNRLFYHGMQPRRTNLCKIRKMIEIIDSGGIKSNRLLGNNLSHGYNGLDYISVCSREKFMNIFEKKNPLSIYLLKIIFVLFYLVIYLLLNLNIWIGSVLNIMTI